MPAPPKDIVERIRKMRYVHVPMASDLMAMADISEAASAIETLRWQLKIRENIVARLMAENERLRDGAAEGCETVCPHVRGTVTQYCSLNFTLTHEEREAIEDAIKTVSDALDLMDGEDCLTTATLHSLLDRLE
jgi:hypothetical protein